MEVLRWFKSNYPDLVSDMKNSEHDYDIENQNPYHMENDVWTHTLMVYNQLEKPDNNLKLMALFHDIGKPMSERRNPKNKRVAFRGHENISSFLAIEILHKFKVEVDNTINIEMILKCINWHTELIRMGEFNEDGHYGLSDRNINKIYKKYNDIELYTYMVDLTKADMRGRITNDSEDIEKKLTVLESFMPIKLEEEKDLKTRPEFIMLIGLPCSGKSTLSQKLLKEKDYVYLNADNMLLEQGTYQKYEDIRNQKTMSKAIVMMKDRLQEACNERKNIILDMTNLTHDNRVRFLDKVPKKYYFIRAINMLASKEFIFDKNNERKKEGKFIPEEELLRMSQKFEYASTYHFHEVEFNILYKGN